MQVNISNRREIFRCTLLLQAELTLFFYIFFKMLVCIILFIVAIEPISIISDAKLIFKLYLIEY